MRDVIHRIISEGIALMIFDHMRDDIQLKAK